MAKFAFITGYISVLCKIICFLVAFCTGYLFYDYEKNDKKKQHGTLWKCLVLSCVMFISTLLCDILMTLVLICHKLDLHKIELNKTHGGDINKNISMFTLPLAAHFTSRVNANKTTRKLSIRYLLVLSLWLFISILFVVGHWINFFQSMYREEKLLDNFLCTYVVVTVIFTMFIFLPLGLFLVIGLN